MYKISINKKIKNKQTSFTKKSLMIVLLPGSQWKKKKKNILSFHMNIMTNVTSMFHYDIYNIIILYIIIIIIIN
jgi:hypothetical protein